MTDNTQMSAAQSAQQMANNNLMLRQALLATGLRMVKRQQAKTVSTLGSVIRINLERIGITTGTLLEIAVPVQITAAATSSPFAPYNLVQSISYTDYSGIQRVLTSGYLLHALNAFRAMRFPDNSGRLGQFITAAETGLDTNILSLPTAVGQGVIYFSLYVPNAYDPSSDLRGAVLSQTIYGDHYITITFAPSFVGADAYTAPYTAGAAVVGTGNGGLISVSAFQHYIMPQQGVAALPPIDLSTIYAVEGNYTDNSNINAGQSKFINWPNNRAITSALHVFDNGGSGVLNGADLNQITLLGNSNTNIREMSPSYLRRQMRHMLGADLAPGVYYMGSRSQPITTQLYGNVQTKFDIQTANATPYFASQYESTYLAGTPLPGVVQ
jgi:hypothetical protein